MSNPTLLSESFERAAYAHMHAMENFRTDGFCDAVRDFCNAVAKLQVILALQAENDQRKAVGASMAYTETDFMRA